MVPRTSSGRGFRGAAAYYLHDKGAQSSERVRFTRTLNLSSDDPARAVGEMIYTAEHANDLKAAAGIKATGRKLEKPVYTFSLSWHPTEKPSDEQMREAGISALKALKMERHQVLMVAHMDTDHPHIHLIVNRVDPETGKAHGLSKDQLILSKWAEGYERAHGKTWCVERVINNAERQKARLDGRSKFVKDKAGQKRDAQPQYDRREKAIAAKRQARETQSLKPSFAPVAALQVEGVQQQRAADIAQAAQQTAREARKRQARARALDEAARRDARKGSQELYRARDLEPPQDSARAAAAFREQQRQEQLERQRQRFTRWQIRQTNALQARQLAERDAHAQAYEARLETAAQAIEQQYGASRRADEKRLAHLIERQAQGSRLSRLVDRMRGYEEERNAIEKNLADIQQRSQEMTAPIIQQEAAARALLQKQHDKQKREQAALFERQIEAGYEVPDAPSRAAKERSRGPVRGARGLER